MFNSKMSGLPIIEEEKATGDVARIYADVKRDLQLPIVPNHLKALAVSPAALAIYWDLTRSFYQNTTLPDSLTSMILFTISSYLSKKPRFRTFWKIPMSIFFLTWSFSSEVPCSMIFS